MFAGIDTASERHMLARLIDKGAPIGWPVTITENHYVRLRDLLGTEPALVVMEATGHCWKNLFVVLTAAGHDAAPINPLAARRFQDASAWLDPFYERLRASGKPPKFALVAAMRKLLYAIYSVANNRTPFVVATEPARAA